LCAVQVYENPFEMRCRGVLVNADMILSCIPCMVSSGMERMLHAKIIGMH